MHGVGEDYDGTLCVVFDFNRIFEVREDVSARRL
jgi:hypothetical protein